MEGHHHKKRKETMMDIKAVKEAAEKELQDEQMKKAKETIKVLLRKKLQAQAVLANIDREIADAYAELGTGNLT
jgi:hypothetical protein